MKTKKTVGYILMAPLVIMFFIYSVFKTEMIIGLLIIVSFFIGGILAGDN